MAEARAEDREVGVTFRMSRARRAKLRSEASAEGVSLQVILERRVFGDDVSEDRRPGPIVRHAELDLDMAM